MKEEELKQEIQVIDEETRALVVNSQETFELANNEIFRIDTIGKKWMAYWKDLIEDAHQMHKNLIAKRDDPIRPLRERRISLKRGTDAYLTEQENIRKEEQRKLDAERLKKEEAERKRLEKRAEKAEEKGNIGKADELRDMAEDVYIPPAIVVPEIEKTTRQDAGTVSQKKGIEVIILDEMAILKAVVGGLLPIGIVSISLPKLTQVIKLQGLTSFEGCMIREVMTTQHRGK